MKKVPEVFISLCDGAVKWAFSVLAGHPAKLRSSGVVWCTSKYRGGQCFRGLSMFSAQAETI